MARTTGRFTKGTNPGTFTCAVCGETRQKGSSESGELCQPCWDEAGEINAHADGYHTDEPHDWCPDCTGAPERGSDEWKAAASVVEADGTPTAATTGFFSVAPSTNRAACECGCGGQPRGERSRFLPGHDAKLASRKAAAK